MEKKNQVMLSAFIMYLIVGFAGYINQFSNYWIVFILSLLVTAYTLTNVFFDDESVRENTKFEWISVCGFFALEVALTICVGIFNVPFIGFFKYFNYGIQILGLGFIFYSIIRFTLSYTKIVSSIKEKLNNRKVEKETVQQVVTTPQESIATKVEETIVQETTMQDAEANLNNLEVVEENEKEPDVIGIEYKKENEIETPYMEEEF